MTTNCNNQKSICAHVDSRSGNTNVYVEDQFYQFTPKHPEYKRLRAAITAFDADEFLRIYESFETKFDNNEKYEIEEEIDVDENSITFRNQRITDPCLMRVIKNYSKQCDAIKLFIDNLFLNPSWESVKQLARFLEHKNFPLTEDGCFLGYKAIKSNYMDKYTGTIDNSIGKTVMVPRDEVTFDPNRACAAGLHVGTYAYARDYGGGDDIIVLVKVNPAHCVSVPFDHSDQKLRCSQYTVIGKCDKLLSIDMVYGMDGKEFSTESYFADIRSEEQYRYKRAQYDAEACDCDDDDDCYDDDEPQVRAMYCDVCDEEFDTDAAFCRYCGNECLPLFDDE